MINYFYLSAKQRQEKSTQMIEREVSSARDDIEAIKRACSTVRMKITTPIKSGAPYLQKADTSTGTAHHIGSQLRMEVSYRALLKRNEKAKFKTSGG